MSKFEKIKTFWEYIKEYRRKRKEEKEILYMQSRGASILKSANFMNHPYMQKPMKQIGLDKEIKIGESNSVINKVESNKED